ncbi:conjugal transfer transcriptional regulator TraJ [Pseudomonas jinjuensis]|nr:conjugal transfer transcriptional regulator TraJ [Pseudomonas jinjuensis]
MKKVQSEATRKSSPPIKVYCLPDEKAHIGAGARNAGKTASSYLLALGMGYEVESVIDAYLVGELVKINADQGRLGGLLKMWLTNDERFAGFEEAQMRRTIGVVLSKIEETQQALLQLAMKVYGDDDENFSG